MRTIVINTLENAYNIDTLFKLPFGPEEISWLKVRMDGLNGCAESIEDILKNAMDASGYRIVLLANLSSFMKQQKEQQIDLCIKLINTYINKVLLEALKTKRILPSAVDVVFMHLKSDGQSNLDPDIQYLSLFGIDDFSELSENITLSMKCSHGYNKEFSLDFSGIFSDCIETYIWTGKTLAESTKKTAKQGEKTEFDLDLSSQFNNQDIISRKTGEVLEGDIRKIVEDAQRFAIPAPDSDLGEELLLQVHKIEWNNDSKEGQQRDWYKVQMMLGNELINLQDNEPIQLASYVFEDSELARKYNRAYSRIQAVGHAIGKMRFKNVSFDFSADLHTEYDKQEKLKVQLQKEKKDLMDAMGILAQSTEQEEQAEEPQIPADHSGLLYKVRRSWFNLKKEKTQFSTLYQAFLEHYSEEGADREQADILNSCASFYQEERNRTMSGNVLLGRPRVVEFVEQTDRPNLDTEIGAACEQLENVQLELNDATAAALADYDDERKNAAAIDAEFQHRSSLWDPKTTRANHRFVLFSLVMGVLFIALMVIPYAGIEWQRTDAGIPTVLYFILVTAGFACVYLVGLIMWIRQYCKVLHELTSELCELYNSSQEKRRESINAAIRMYGLLLPGCLYYSKCISELRQLDKENADSQCGAGYHKELLSEIEDMLGDMGTALQLTHDDYVPSHDLKTEQSLIDLTNPAFVGQKNRNFYYLFKG